MEVCVLDKSGLPFNSQQLSEIRCNNLLQLIPGKQEKESLVASCKNKTEVKIKQKQFVELDNGSNIFFVCLHNNENQVALLTLMTLQAPCFDSLQ